MGTILRSRLWMLAAALLLLSVSASADIRFRPQIDNSRPVSSGGECVIRLAVDGQVDVVMRPNDVYVRTISGREAHDAGSVCSSPMPSDMANLNFERGEGRGDMEVISRPGERGNALVVRINDPSGGGAPYSFRVTWQGAYNNGREGWTGRGLGDRSDRGMQDEAITACQNAAANRLRRRGYRNLQFGDIHTDRDGDVIVGEATGARRFFSSDFQFTCQMDQDRDAVLSVNVTRQ